MRRPPTSPPEFFADPLLMSSSGEAGRCAWSRTGQWQLACRIRFVDVCIVLPVCVARQTTQQGTRSSTRGKAYSHKGHSVHIQSREKRAATAVRSLVCSIFTGHLQPPKHGTPASTRRCGHACDQEGRQQQTQTRSHHPAAGVAERHVGCALLRQRWPPEKCDPQKW